MLAFKFAGFTLLEVLISLVIFTTVLLGALFSAGYNARESQQSYYYAVAYHFLREFNAHVQQGDSAESFMEAWSADVNEQLPDASVTLANQETEVQLCWSFGGQQCVSN